MRCLLGVLLVGLLILPLRAAPVVDGTVDAAYGPALAVQAVQTGFGDASPPGSLGGRELDAAYATISGGNVGTNASGTALTQNLDFAINDNNAAGVSGGSGAANPADALAVTTGMEFSIALADLGNPAPGSVIRIAAMINNGDHNYLSNQILGTLLPPQGNLGGDGSGGFTGKLGGRKVNPYAGLPTFVS